MPADTRTTDVTKANNQPERDATPPWPRLPDIDLRQLLTLTDDTGIFQHALYATPDPNHGYCIDDNARALIAALYYAGLSDDGRLDVPLHRYLAFLTYAFNEDKKVFRNFMSYDRKWLEEVGSMDSQGRTIWALGYAVMLAPDEMVRGLAGTYLEKGLPAIEDLTYIRSWAFSLIGLDAFLSVEPEQREARELRDRYAERLLAGWKAHATADWPWWEDIVRYDNAKLCQALMACGRAMDRRDMIDAGIDSLRWLIEQQTAEAGHLSIIGNDGWLPRGGERAAFDQQPLEAYAMVEASLLAARVTGDASWEEKAWTCFKWFVGENDLGVPLYREDTGGCQDGLQPHGANKNQGAESVLAYLLSVLEFHRHTRDRAADA